MGHTIACETIEREKMPAQQPAPSETKYGAFLEGMKRSRVHEGRKEIRETDTDFIHTFHVKKGYSGKVMEMHCPESKAVSICGQSQANGDDAYFFSLRCTGSDGREPSPSTKMNFKSCIGDWVSPLCKVSYGSLNKYYFRDGLFLENGDRLIIEIIDSDIDIERVEAAVEADIFNEPC